MSKLFSFQKFPSEPPGDQIFDPETHEPIPQLLDRPWLENKPKAQLIEYIVTLAKELKSRPIGKTATDFDFSRLQPDASTIRPSEGTPPYYIRLPVRTDKSPEEVEATRWRIVLSRFGGDDQPLGLDIHDDVVIGRLAEGVNIDLDLSPLGAEELGVSRLHAVIRPKRRHLFIYDLGSSNGTACDGQPCTADAPGEILETSVLRFGALFLRAQILKRPSDR
jgi:hypothetical protein